MNRYKLYKAGIYTNQGIQRFNGNEQLYEKCINEFKKDQNFTDLCIAVEQKNISDAFLAAHCLKGISGNLSFVELYKDIYPLVEELRAGSFDKVPLLLEQVAKDYKAIIDVLENKST